VINWVKLKRLGHKPRSVPSARCEPRAGGWIFSPSSRREQAGFTLAEIMIVVAIIGLLAAIALPNFTKARKTATHNQFIAELRVAYDAFAMYSIEHGRYPPDTTPSQIPAGMRPYLSRMHWTDKTPIGGQWDWDNGQFGSKAGVSVYKPSVPDEEMREIDALIDDGDLSTGAFQKRADGFIYVMEK
jgi:prepilin-type N-terminal cleavage/methylation domain-containing protein